MIAWLANLMDLMRRMVGVPTEVDSHALVEEILSEMMDFTSCKLSVIFCVTKTICKKAPGCESLTAFYT